jgi:hypothetical protein
VGAWHKWLMIMQRAVTEQPAEPVAKKPFVPKYPDIPVREDYSSPADEMFWNFFPHNLVSRLGRTRAEAMVFGFAFSQRPSFFRIWIETKSMLLLERSKEGAQIMGPGNLLIKLSLSSDMRRDGFCGNAKAKDLRFGSTLGANECFFLYKSCVRIRGVANKCPCCSLPGAQQVHLPMHMHACFGSTCPGFIVLLVCSLCSRPVTPQELLQMHMRACQGFLGLLQNFSFSPCVHGLLRN